LDFCLSILALFPNFLNVLRHSIKRHGVDQLLHLGVNRAFGLFHRFPLLTYGLPETRKTFPRFSDFVQPSRRLWSLGHGASQNLRSSGPSRVASG
jgi:hypothetical protein